MSNIFDDKNIYPYNGPIKEHFQGFYENIFVGLLPFFKVENHYSEKNNYKKFEEISLEQVKEETDVLINIHSTGARIYNYSNKEYPTDIEIYNDGKIICWKTIANETKLKSVNQINKALRTSIGALRPIFRKPELSELLDNYTSNQNIWNPTEGQFDVFTKITIYKVFKLFCKTDIIIVDEFFERTTMLNLNEISDFEFSEKVGVNDYYIYSSDKEILFTMDWDSFFFLLASDKNKIETIISNNFFEGFLCDDKTTHDWDYFPNELNELLEIEKELELKKTKKKWWHLWN